jgi:hypothetical protein
MEVVERKGSAVAARMSDVFSLGSQLLYIGLGESSLAPNIAPMTYSVKKHGGSRGFLCLEPMVWLGRTPGFSPYQWSPNFKMLRYFGRHFFIRTPMRCSLARWTRMDESYNAMVLDLYFDMMEKD